MAVVLFLLLIVFHEFGHFIVAKLSGIKVNEFAIGMGPLIFSKEKGETTYSLRLIPIGGYCAMEGEDEESNDPRSYDNAASYKRFLTILAGPMANLIIALVVFTIVGFCSGVVTNQIGNFTEDSPAKASGLEIGDEIREVNKKEIKDFSDIPKYINEFYEKNSEGTPILVTSYRKSTDTVSINEIACTKHENSYALGIEAKLRKTGFLEAIGLGFKETGKNIVMIFVILKRLFTGALSFGALSGPVGVLKEIGNQAANGLMSLLYFLGYISVNLAVFNLLPIPALDGSKLLTSGLEMIFGIKVNKKIEEKVTIVGFFVLIGLIVLVSIKDLINLF